MTRLSLSLSLSLSLWRSTLALTMTPLIFVAGLGSTGVGQDWPSWRGANRDAKLSGFKAPAKWPDELKKGWQVEVGTGHATPALVGDRLYVHARQGEDEVTLCLMAASGKEVWRDEYPAPYKMDPTATKHGKGPKSSVSVVDGRVFTFGINGVLTCYDAKTGKVGWRHAFKDDFPKTSPRYGQAMSPLVHGGMCIVHAGGDEKGALMAFDVVTGKETWRWTGDGPAYTSPIVRTIAGKPQLITQTRMHTVGLSPTDGKLLWKIPFETVSEQNSVSPVVFKDLVVLSGYHYGTVAYKLGGEEPEEAWKISKVSMYMSTPVLQDNHFYGFSEKRRGQYVCVDIAEGEIAWRGDGRQGENAALVDGGDVILALNTDSELVVFKKTTEDFEEIARYEVADAPTWAHPVISGNTVYIKCEKMLTRWTIE